MPTHFHVLSNLNCSLRVWTGFVWSSREPVAGSCEQLMMLWVLQGHGIRKHLNKYHLFNKCFYHGKSQFFPVPCHEGVWEEEVYLQTLLTSVLELSCQLYDLASLFLCFLNGRIYAPHRQSESCEKWKVSCHCRELNPDFSTDQSALRYKPEGRGFGSR
jgi:hypothetical protein